ncbi:MAG TPA: hypothetical protein VLZ89_14250, partial [Anaerolineales bacterium]|nr:hypothetical protein [Anaerolineales bacterium]
MKEKRILPFFNLGGPDLSQPVYRKWREGLIRPILNIALVFGFIALVAGLSTDQSMIVSLVFVGAYVVLVLAALLPVPFWARAGLILLIVYALGLNELFSLGIEGDGIFFFLALIILTTMFYSPRGGLAA